MMRNATGKHAWRALAGFTFAEASFFPIPDRHHADSMVMADRAERWALAAWCTLWSVLGGMLRLCHRRLSVRFAGPMADPGYFTWATCGQFQQWYARYGAWVIMVKGSARIPYKLVTIASGFAHYSFAMFMLLSVITAAAAIF
jgi:membrane protein YqaA with SNARE-associated domain